MLSLAAENQILPGVAIINVILIQICLADN